MALTVVALFGTLVSASESRKSRRASSRAQQRQVQRQKRLSEEEEKEKFQATSRLLARRRRRDVASGRSRATVLTGSELGSAGGGGKTLLGE